MKTLIFAILVTAASAAGCNLFAASQLSLQIDNVQWRGGTHTDYNAFDSGEYPQVVSFKVLLTGDPTAFFVTFSTSGDPLQRKAFFANNQLEYQIYDSSVRRTVLKDLPSATSSEVIQGAFSAGETIKQLNYTIIVPPQQIVRAGMYSDSIRVTVYQGTPAQFIENDSKTVEFSVRVDQVAQVSFSGPDGAFNPQARSSSMDFGSLARGKMRGLDVRVRSNAGYRVDMVSEFGGVLRHSDPRIKSTIPYQLTVGGTPLGLSVGRQTAIVRKGRVTNPSGDVNKMEVTIGEVKEAIAGAYRDYITITVTSEE